MGCAREARLLVGRQPRASGRCTGCATPSSTAGREPLELEEHSHAGHGRGLRRRSGQPAVRRAARLRRHRPARRTRRCDSIDCPFTGERLAAVRALRPDVGIVHAQQADRRGNVQLWGISGVQKEAVLASARSLVTVEEIVDELEPRAGRDHPAWLGRDRRRRGAGRRAPVLRPRLLRARQRLLRALGRDQPRPRGVRRVDARARAGDRGREYRSQHETGSRET